ncbi:FKBP-type peptidyl-prolyl cis-trans isomerase [Sphingomonas sp. FW199]|uniref:FKBP-type peptidyl-prolyl cis-trans isomerase n=1 Tax=Sphingomonas sp. FW199 TaxID=3400217 RepID=UPI003CEC93A2
MAFAFLSALIALVSPSKDKPVSDTAPIQAGEATQIIESEIGTGAEAQPGRMVRVHYTGWLLTEGTRGKKFDSSLDRGEPIAFPLGTGRVIRGWDLGINGMKVGGKRTLVIPAVDGYGARGAGGVIPPGADLIFDVELVGVD